jgi:pimeloyl-ACP methyl ester carboxylesterase
MKKYVWQFLKGLVICYFVALLFLFIFQEKMLFIAPDIHLKNKKTYEEHAISFERNGIVLRGWFVNKGVSKEGPLVVYYGGNGEELSGSLYLKDRLPKASMLFVNYRGYGESEGSPSEKEIFADALHVLDQITEKNKIDYSNVIVYGRSLGSGVAVHVAHHRPVRSVVLITPYDSIANVAQDRYPIFPISWIIRHPFHSKDLAFKINKPMLMVVAKGDSIIPNRLSENLYKAWAGPKKYVVLLNSSHNYLDQEGYWGNVVPFLNKIY